MHDPLRSKKIKQFPARPFKDVEKYLKVKGGKFNINFTLNTITKIQYDNIYIDFDNWYTFRFSI